MSSCNNKDLQVVLHVFNKHFKKTSKILNKSINKIFRIYTRDLVGMIYEEYGSYTLTEKATK